MNLSTLAIFKAVVDEGGIGAAGRRLHRVPSSITTRIQQLEATLGAQLFIRERRRLHLSPAGERFLGYAEQLLDTWNEARAAMADRTPSGPLRLGTLESTAASRLPDVLARYHERYPGVAVELTTGTTDALLAAVLARELVAAFVADAKATPALSAAPVFREELVVIAPRDHPVIRRPRDARTDTVISFPVGCAYRRRVQAWLGEGEVTAERVLDLGSYHAIVACVAAGTGIAMVPRSVLDTLRHSDVSLHQVPARIARSVTSLVWRSDTPSPARQALLAAVTRRARR